MIAPKDLHKKGLQLAEQDDLPAALQCIQEYLTHFPQDGTALNDAGTILCALGRHDQALEHLRRAMSLTSDSRCTLNYAEACLSAGRPAQAMGLFDALHAEGLLTPELVNRTAQGLLAQDDCGSAVEALLASEKLWPNQAILQPMLKNLRHLRPRIAFFCDTNWVTFVRDIYNSVSQRHETHFCTNYSPEGIANLMDWCDIAFFEWCTQQVVTATSLPKKCKIIVRLHRFEAYQIMDAGGDPRPLVGMVNWNNVDALVTVGNQHVYKHLLGHVPNLEQMTRSVVIPNGVDLQKYPFTERPRGKNLACVAYLNLPKNQMFLLHCFHRLHQIDPEYKLFFAGAFQDDVLRHYLEHMVQELGLSGSVFFDGWQSNISSWLADKHYLVTSSVVENHPMNVLEGMARGLKPVIHAYPGSNSLFPKKYLWRTMDEFCDAILKENYQPQEYRDFVAERYSLDKQLTSVNNLLRELESQIEPKSVQEKRAAEKEQQDRKYYDSFWMPTPAADAATETFSVEDLIDQAAEACQQDQQSPTKIESLAAAEHNQPDPMPARPANVETEWERARHDRLLQILRATRKSELEKLDILDLGCGRGLLAARLAEFGEVTGVDWSAEAIELATSNCPDGTFIYGNVLKTPLPKNSFDIVTSVEVIEHLSPEDQRQYLEIVHQALRPGGLLLLTTPNAPVIHRLNAWYKENHGKAWSEQPIENWLTATGLLDIAEKAGLTMRGMETVIDTEQFVGIHLLLVACKRAD